MDAIESTSDISALVERLGYDADGLLFISDADFAAHHGNYGHLPAADVDEARRLHSEMTTLSSDHPIVRVWADAGYGVTVGLVRGHHIVSLDDCTDEPKWWRTIVFSSEEEAMSLVSVQSAMSA